MQADAVRDGWTELLTRYQWDWFLTMTFRDRKDKYKPDYVHPEVADKLWRVFVSKLNRRLYGQRWYRTPGKSIYWVRAMEWQKRGVLHYHALAGDTQSLNTRASRRFWKEEWFLLAGIARIDRVFGIDDVAAYVSKYVVKGGEIDVSPSLACYARQLSSLGVGIAH